MAVADDILPLLDAVSSVTHTRAEELIEAWAREFDGLDHPPSEKVPDRAEAITRAISMAQPRDIVLIAGKGHEAYQEFADHTVPFDDLQVARRALENHPVEF